MFVNTFFLHLAGNTSYLQVICDLIERQSNPLNLVLYPINEGGQIHVNLVKVLLTEEI